MPYNHSWNGVFNPGNAEDFFQETSGQSFEARNLNFSRTNAWWLSELCRLIYVRGGRLEANTHQVKRRNHFLRPVGLQEKWFYDGRYVQCSLVGPSSAEIEPFSILVFRGTSRGEGSRFFLLDLILSPWPMGGRVHRGFKRVLLDAWKEIQPQLAAAQGPLFYTGHSLGGALAVLSATLQQPEAVYTFGCPRMADEAFIKMAGQLNIFRVVNSRDIVASVPPLHGFLHVGKHHQLIAGPLMEEKRHWFDAPGFLADHSPVNYSLLGLL